MAIRIMEEGPDLVAPIDGRGDKLGSAGAQHLVGSRGYCQLDDVAEQCDRIAS